ncbi:MAG: UPF0147 family protein [Candidatus Woesearchaeota archaeon]
MVEDALTNVKAALEEMRNDTTLPKNVKAKIGVTLDLLNQEHVELSLRINKALHTLDELVDESNLEPFVRTQIWNIVSLLEMIGSKL